MKLNILLLAPLVLVPGCNVLAPTAPLPVSTTLPVPATPSRVSADISLTTVPETLLPVTPDFSTTLSVTDITEPVQKTVAATNASYPVQGSAVWEDGKCCIGGLAGDTLQARVTFSATSPFGIVREMRVLVGSLCYQEDRLAEAIWEPYAPSAIYPVPVALNWIGYYISVQYRDEYGNLSPIYCDDISVEGFPPITPSPSP